MKPTKRQIQIVEHFVKQVLNEGSSTKLGNEITYAKTGNFNLKMVTNEETSRSQIFADGEMILDFTFGGGGTTKVNKSNLNIIADVLSDFIFNNRGNRH